jgi:hypothetical protein
MKSLLFLFALVLIASVTPAFAQINKNAFEIGAGYASTESGTPMPYAEYTRRLTSKVGLGLSVGYVSGITNNRPYLYSDSRIWLGDVTVYYLPFARLKTSNPMRSVWRLHSLKIGAGAGGRRLDQYRLVGTAIGTQQPDALFEDRKNKWALGFNLVLEYEMVRLKDWYLGLRGSLHNYDGGESVGFVGLNLGRNF